MDLGTCDLRLQGLFQKNMKSLGMNKITIWNDFAPLNARSIIEEAHRNGIGVVWGFAWGWDTDCRSIAAELDESMLKDIKKSVVSVFLIRPKMLFPCRP